jgi:hypothetical protein
MGLSVARRRLLTVVAILGAGGIASLASGWRAPQMAELSPSDIVALRFSDAWDDPESSASTDPAEFDAAYERRLVLFSPYPLYPPVLRQVPAPISAAQTERQPPAQTDDRAPATPHVVATAEPAAETKTQPQKPQSQVQAPAKPAVAPAPRATHRSAAVLNDAQIASIKKRLNLSPDQEHMWPSVEAALRKLVYAKSPATSRNQARLGPAIDPNSTELQSLKSAAIPLVLSFDDSQKRELRTLVQVMGLEKLAAQL